MLDVGHSGRQMGTVSLGKSSKDRVHRARRLSLYSVPLGGLLSRQESSGRTEAGDVETLSTLKKVRSRSKVILHLTEGSAGPRGLRSPSVATRHESQSRKVAQPNIADIII